MEEYPYVDEGNLFDALSIFIGFGMILTHIVSYFSELNYWYTSLSQEYHYEILIFMLEISLLSTALLIKPYETIKFVNWTTFYLPLLIFGFYFVRYFAIYQFTLIEGFVFMPWRVLIYLLIYLCYVFIKGYILFKIKWEDKDQ